jgi:hypothetical protein
MSLVLLVAFGGLAIAADEPQQSSASVAANDEHRRICRSAPATGTIIGRRRECHTRAEWAQIDEQNGDSARRMMRDNQGQLDRRSQ